jgi:hypothetical protein
MSLPFGCLPIRGPTDQPLELRINRRIAFAATVLKALDIENMDASASVVDEASLLEFSRYQGYAAALHTQHLREKFLGPRKAQFLADIVQTSNEDKEVRCLAPREKPKNGSESLVEASVHSAAARAGEHNWSLRRRCPRVSLPTMPFT